MWLPRRVETFFDKIESCLCAIQEALREQQRTARAARETKQHAQDEIRWQRFVTRITERRIRKSSERETQAHNKKTYRQQVILNFLTLLAVLAAVFYATVAAYQGFLMRGQLAQMITTAQASQASADAANAALDLQDIQMEQNRINNARSMEQAEKSLQATIDNFRTEQRPWIGLASQPVLSEANFVNTSAHPSPITLGWTSSIQNFGTTPAFNIFQSIQLIPGEDAADLDRAAQLTVDQAVVELGGKPVNNVKTSDQWKSLGTSLFPHVTLGWNPQAMNFPFGEVKAQKLTMVACIVYKDQFGKKLYWTRACMSAYPNTALGTPLKTCLNYNDAGEQDLQQQNR